MSKVTGIVWISGAEVTAPGAGTQLVRVIVSAGRIGKLYGGRIVSQEANAAGKVWRLRASIQGTVVILGSLDVTNPTWISERVPMGFIKGNGVDFFEIINVVAGVASTLHQAALLYAEEEHEDPYLQRVPSP